MKKDIVIMNTIVILFFLTVQTQLSSAEIDVFEHVTFGHKDEVLKNNFSNSIINSKWSFVALKYQSFDKMSLIFAYLSYIFFTQTRALKWKIVTFSASRAMEYYPRLYTSNMV